MKSGNYKKRDDKIEDKEFFDYDATTIEDEDAAYTEWLMQQELLKSKYEDYNEDTFRIKTRNRRSSMRR